MRFWVRCDDRIEFKYSDELDKEICERCLDEVIIGKCPKSRYAVRNSRNGAEYIYCHNKNTVAKQARHISKITTEAFPSITRAANERSRDLNKIQTIAYHNAKKMNASIGQKIDKLIPYEEYKREEGKINIIKSVIQSSPDAVSREILSVRKTVEQIEAEYNLIEVLDLNVPLSDNDLTLIKAHKLLMLGFYYYQEEFSKKRIYVKISETNLSVNVDYGVAKSAIGQIFNNAVKYCKPQTTLDVSINIVNEYIEISFMMKSLYFEEKEAKKFTELRTRGRYVADIPGEGVGLYAVHHFMRVHKGYFKMKSNPDTCFNSGDKTYSDNEFILGFLKPN